MPFNLTMPKLSPTMEAGTIVKWHKKEGDFLQSGDLLFEVATDKAVVEHQALDEGWLRKILLLEGEEGNVNDPVAILTEEKEEDITEYLKKIEEGRKKQENEIQSASEVNHPAEEKKIPPSSGFLSPQFFPEPPLKDVYPFQAQDDLKASPLAKKLAKEKGLDLSHVKGSGPRGRIVSRDLDKAPQAPKIIDKKKLSSLTAGAYEEIPLSPIRKTIGQRLQESKTFIPHFYVTSVIDAEPLIECKEQLKAYGFKITVNDLFVKATALALREHMEMNRGFHSVNQSIIQFQTVDLAIAVSLAEGLITPIIRHADCKNLAEIASEIKALAQKAKEGKLKTEEYKGGSFTISNLGMYGVSNFQAIINPPQSAILAIGGIQEIPVVKQEKIVPGKTISLTLSVDHRVIDGATAAVFLQTLKRNVENPAGLLFFIN